MAEVWWCGGVGVGVFVVVAEKTINETLSHFTTVCSTIVIGGVANEFFLLRGDDN